MKMKVVIDSETYEVEIEDIHARPVVARVAGERFEVWPESDEPAGAGWTAPVITAPETTTSALASTSGASDNAKVLPAPLPGVIIAILVKPGDTVTRGQELCTLEAMKMKNAIRSSRDGVVATVEVAVGDQVGHGQILLTFQE